VKSSRANFFLSTSVGIVIIGPECVTTLGAKTIDIIGPARSIRVTTSIWNVLNTSVSVAFAVVGIDARARYRQHLRGGEENIGEGGLEALHCRITIAGVVRGGVRVGVHELHPNLLDRTKLSQMELIIGAVDATDGERITTECVRTDGLGGDGAQGVCIVAVDRLPVICTPTGAGVGLVGAMANAHIGIHAAHIRMGKRGYELMISVGNVTVMVLRRRRCHLDG